jgi:hypothetical protein
MLMMKKMILPVLLLALLSCNNNTEEKKEKKDMFSDLVAENLKGDLVSYEEMSYTADSTGKTGEMDSCCVTVMEYDENGNATKWSSKDSKGTVKEYGTITRYDNGLWRGQKNFKDDKTANSFETIMDDKGQYTGGNAYDSAGKLEFYYTGLSQNEQAQILSWKQWDKDSVYRMEGLATYDKYNQTAFTLKDSVGKVKNSTARKFNDKSELIEEADTNMVKDSAVVTVKKYTYDAYDQTGNWTQRTTLDDKGKATKVVKRVYAYRKAEEKK